MSENTEKKEKASKGNDSSMSKLTVTLGAISAACALVLGIVYTVTGPAIAANQAAKNAKAMAEVLPASAYTEVAYSGDDAAILSMNKADDAGYVVEVNCSGGSFSGNLTIMVGVDNDGGVTGVAITKTGETSGLGANAGKPLFKDQFAGFSGTASVTKDGGTIKPITGATITSRAVCAGVNAAVAAVASLG